MQCESDIYQAVRVFDVLVLGPLMVRAGSRISGIAGTILAVSGVATIVFNGITLIDIERGK